MMGKSIRAIETPAGPPFRILLSMVCEGDHGMYKPAPVNFEGNDFLAMRQEAAQQGWHYRGVRLLGPCCTKTGH